jgi:hypothetical protein
VIRIVIRHQQRFAQDGLPAAVRDWQRSVAGSLIRSSTSLQVRTNCARFRARDQRCRYPQAWANNLPAILDTCLGREFRMSIVQCASSRTCQAVKIRLCDCRGLPVHPRSGHQISRAPPRSKPANCSARRHSRC